jgi:hypothetical protein
VLYLRGFDYQAAVGVGGGLAMGFSTVDSTRFNHRLGALLGHDCEVYKALSPSTSNGKPWPSNAISTATTRR